MPDMVVTTDGVNIVVVISDDYENQPLLKCSADGSTSRNVTDKTLYA